MLSNCVEMMKSGTERLRAHLLQPVPGCLQVEVAVTLESRKQVESKAPTQERQLDGEVTVRTA